MGRSENGGGKTAAVEKVIVHHAGLGIKPGKFERAD